MASSSRRYFSGSSKQAAAAKVRAATRQIEKGLPIPDARITLAAVAERWLADGLRHDLATNTKAEKRAQVTFIGKRIGGVRAVDLTPSDCASLVNDMLADGLSNSYAGRMRSTAMAAPRRAAKRWGDLSSIGCHIGCQR